MRELSSAIDTELQALKCDAFSYFEHEANPINGLVIDKTTENWPASIAATGFALAAYPVGVERGFISRTKAIERTLATLRFFRIVCKGPPQATTPAVFLGHATTTQTAHKVIQQTKHRSGEGANDDAVDVDRSHTTEREPRRLTEKLRIIELMDTSRPPSGKIVNQTMVRHSQARTKSLLTRSLLGCF
jgi:hypothetical protein